MSRGPLDLDKLAAAKLWLISESTGSSTAADTPRDQPYLAHALYALVPVAAPSVPRLTCDERWRVYVNPDWLTSASVPEIGRELAHVTWHLLLDHAGRARDQHVDSTTSKAWTDASDATVAYTLADGGLCPATLASADDLDLPDNRSAEEYFAILGRMPVELEVRREPARAGGRVRQRCRRRPARARAAAGRRRGRGASRGRSRDPAAGRDRVRRAPPTDRAW